MQYSTDRTQQTVLTVCTFSHHKFLRIKKSVEIRPPLLECIQVQIQCRLYKRMFQVYFLNPSISFAFSFLYNTCVCLSSLISHRGCFNFHGISRMVLISVFHFHLFKVLRNLPQFDRTSLSNKVLWRNFRGCL